MVPISFSDLDVPGRPTRVLALCDFVDCHSEKAVNDRANLSGQCPTILRAEER